MRWPNSGRRVDRPSADLEDGRRAAARGGAQHSRRDDLRRSAHRCAGAARGAPTADTAHAPRYNALALKALVALELDARANEAIIKARYKELVKRHHPDANGGDRSSEDKLREIIQAYNYLRANKLV